MRQSAFAAAAAAAAAEACGRVRIMLVAAWWRTCRRASAWVLATAHAFGSNSCSAVPVHVCTCMQRGGVALFISGVHMKMHACTRGMHAPQLLFFDTEGFESAGKADAYDDRIFALSALLSR